MTTPSTRTPVRIARGSYSNLNSSFSDLAEGEIVYAQDENTVYIKEGSSLVKLDTTYTVGDGGLTQNNFTDADHSKLDGIAAGANVGLTDIVGDTSPQLGGNLDVNSQDIVSTSNGDIDLDPDGSGKVVFKGNATKGSGQFKLNCENNSHGIIIKGPPHSAGASYTLTLPNDDGAADEVLKTDGSGNLDWVAQSGGGGGGGSTTLSSDAQGNTIGGTNAGDSFSGTSAEKNTLFGYNAGTALETGDENTFYGYDAGKVCTYRRNTAIGYNAGIALVDGQLNSILGWKAAESLTTGTGNTIVGAYEAGNNITTGSNNIVLGQAYANSTGSNNIVIGNVSLMNSSDSENTVIGTGDMYCQSTTGSIVIGHDARHGQSGPGGDNCITLGYTNITHLSVPGINFELKDNGGAATEGQVLTADSNGYGYWADASGGGGGGLSSDAQRNTVGGTNAGDSFTGTDATDNTFIGYDAGTAYTSGDKNVAIGSYAFKTQTTANGSVGIGYQAGELVNNDGHSSTYIGHRAGSRITEGSMNTAIGYDALRTDGALYGGGSESYGNVAIGNNAMGTCGISRQNCAIGWNTLKSNAAWSNTAIGNSAGENNTSGTRNLFLSRYAGASNTSGSYNNLLGWEAGADITTGSNNTCIGDSSGHTGTNNLTTGSNNTLIGCSAAASSATVSNEITLGDSNVTALRCQVQTISSLSDERDKTQIEELPVGLDFVSQLKPVKFKWKSREGIAKDGDTESGFIAQDFQKAQKDNDADYLGLVYDNNPDRLEASYGKLIPVLVKAIQELKMEIETLKNNG